MLICINTGVRSFTDKYNVQENVSLYCHTRLLKKTNSYVALQPSWIQPVALIARYYLMSYYRIGVFLLFITWSFRASSVNGSFRALYFSFYHTRQILGPRLCGVDLLTLGWPNVLLKLSWLAADKEVGPATATTLCSLVLSRRVA